MSSVPVYIILFDIPNTFSTILHWQSGAKALTHCGTGIDPFECKRMFSWV